MTPTRALFAILTVATALAAQRQSPTFEWQKRTTTLAYGAAPVGKHSLAELPVGETWRLGMNEASTWQLGMPVLVGGVVIAPGSYRVRLQRTAEDRCAIVVEGSSQAIGVAHDARVDGALGKATKPTKKLAIDWLRAGAGEHGNQPVQVHLQFGDLQWLGDVTVLGGKTMTAGEWKVTTFAGPEAPPATRDKAPVALATVQRGKDEAWNLVVGKNEARLVPWMAAPKEDFGFGAIVPPDASRLTTGSVEVFEVPADAATPIAEARAATVDKGELVIEVHCGREGLRARVPEPKAKAK